MGQAAELAGWGKRTFMELPSRYNLPFFDYDPSEIASDIKNAGHFPI